MADESIPRAFFWRRVHSLAGFWLVLYVIEHLFVNSQAALAGISESQGFIKAVNGIQALPYLRVVEILFLGVPILIHMIAGIWYAYEGKLNTFYNSGTDPYLPEYPRNQAYSWQRITSYLLVIGIIGHVVHMRFLEYPYVTSQDGKSFYMVKVQDDLGLQTLSKSIAFDIQPQALHPTISLAKDQVVAVADNFGTVEFLMLRNTFKSPLMIILYTIFVLATCFHAFNGLWTFLIKWGVTVTNYSQKLFLKFCMALMVLVTCLGLAAIWGTYWMNLRF